MEIGELQGSCRLLPSALLLGNLPEDVVPRTLVAYHGEGKMSHTNGRPYCHSGDAEAASAHPIHGVAVCHLAVALSDAVEEHLPGCQLDSFQLVWNQHAAGGFHQDTQCDDNDGVRVIVRVPLRAAGQPVGHLAFSTSASGAGGGVLLDLTNHCLGATKAILGKGSPPHHAVVVPDGSTLSILLECGPENRHCRQLRRWVERIRQCVSQPLLAVAVDVFAPDIRKLPPIPRLHSYAAAGGRVGKWRCSALGLCRQWRLTNATAAGCGGGWHWKRRADSFCSALGVGWCTPCMPDWWQPAACILPPPPTCSRPTCLCASTACTT